MIIIIILILLNIGTLAFLLFTGHKPPPPPPNPMGRQHHPVISERLKEPLNLTDAQATSIDSMHELHFKVMDSLTNDFHNAVSSYFMLLTKENYSLKEKDSLLSKMNNINASKAQTAFEAFENIRKVLNDDQKKKYNEILPEILQNVINRNEGRQDMQGPPQGFPPPPHP